MRKEAVVYSKEGQDLVRLTAVATESDYIVMQGKLMGTWESTMYIPPESVVGMMGLLAKRQLLWYIICLPFFLRRRNKAMQRSS